MYWEAVAPNFYIDRCLARFPSLSQSTNYPLWWASTSHALFLTNKPAKILKGKITRTTASSILKALGFQTTDGAKRTDLNSEIHWEPVQFPSLFRTGYLIKKIHMFAVSHPMMCFCRSNQTLGQKKDNTHASNGSSDFQYMIIMREVRYSCNNHPTPNTFTRTWSQILKSAQPTWHL